MLETQKTISLQPIGSNGAPFAALNSSGDVISTFLDISSSMPQLLALMQQGGGAGETSATQARTMNQLRTLLNLNDTNTPSLPLNLMGMHATDGISNAFAFQDGSFTNISGNFQMPQDSSAFSPINGAENDETHIQGTFAQADTDRLIKPEMKSTPTAIQIQSQQIAQTLAAQTDAMTLSTVISMSGKLSDEVEARRKKETLQSNSATRVRTLGATEDVPQIPPISPTSYFDINPNTQQFQLGNSPANNSIVSSIPLPSPNYAYVPAFNIYSGINFYLMFMQVQNDLAASLYDTLNRLGQQARDSQRWSNAMQTIISSLTTAHSTAVIPADVVTYCRNQHVLISGTQEIDAWLSSLGKTDTDALDKSSLSVVQSALENDANRASDSAQQGQIRLQSIVQEYQLSMSTAATLRKGLYDTIKQIIAQMV